MAGGNWPLLGVLLTLLLLAFAPEDWGKKLYTVLEGAAMTAGRAVTFLWSWVASLDHRCEEAFMRATLTRIAFIGTLAAISASALVYFFTPTK